jgi:folate-binding protein YgfZ
MTDTTPAAPGATHLADRALLRIAGDDVRGFLQGLVTQDMASVTPETPCWAALLSPQGKVLFDFILWADDQDILIDCEEKQAEPLIRRLTLYRLRRAVSISRESTVDVHWSLARRPGAVPDPRLPALGWRWLSEDRGKEADAAWRAHRLSLGVTEGTAELGQDKTLWLECNAAELNGVSFTKGCYVGQENTARMHYRAKVNRRLIVAPLGEPGDRTRAVYPELGLMVELRRVEALGDAQRPRWLAFAPDSD